MRKFILVLAFLCLPMLSNAGEISVNLPDSIAIADTNAARVDTAYSSWVRIEGARKMQFYSFVRPPFPPAVDTNFADDTFFVDIEISFDKIVVSKVFLIDTFLTTGSAWAALVDDKVDLLNADSLRGNWMRLRAVHHAPDMACPGCVNNNYGKAVTLYYTIQR